MSASERKKIELEFPEIEDRKDCKSEYSYSTANKIGEGQYGSVYGKACDLEKKCIYAVKKTLIENGLDAVSSEVDAIYIKSLQKEKWRNSKGKMEYLVPRFFDSFFCKNFKEFTLVMEEWTGDMNQLGRIQFDKFIASNGDKKTLYSNGKGKRNVAYTEAQIKDMFKIAATLDKLGIIHGDVKSSQMLYMKNGLHMCITDFGLATSYGWSSAYGLSCPSPFSYSRDEQVPLPFKPFFNQWQLEQNLLRHTNTFVILPSHGKSMLKHFGGLKWPIDILAFTRQYCFMDNPTMFPSLIGSYVLYPVFTPFTPLISAGTEATANEKFLRRVDLDIRDKNFKQDLITYLQQIH